MRFVCLSMFLFSMFACFYSRHILGFRICVMLSASQTSLLDSVLSQLHATLERQIAIFAFSKPFAHATFCEIFIFYMFVCIDMQEKTYKKDCLRFFDKNTMKWSKQLENFIKLQEIANLNVLFELKWNLVGSDLKYLMKFMRFLGHR